MTPEQELELLRLKAKALGATKVKQEQPSGGVLREAKIQAQGLAAGVGSFPGFVADVASVPTRTAGGLMAITGDITGTPSLRKKGEELFFYPSFAQKSADIVGGAAGRMLGAPTNLTAGEKARQKGSEFVGSLIGGGAARKGVQGLAKAAEVAAPRVSQALRSVADSRAARFVAPSRPSDLAAAYGAGVGSEILQQYAGESVPLQIAAGLAGGLGGAVAGGGAYGLVAAPFQKAISRSMPKTNIGQTLIDNNITNNYQQIAARGLEPVVQRAQKYTGLMEKSTARAEQGLKGATQELSIPSQPKPLIKSAREASEASMQAMQKAKKNYQNLYYAAEKSGADVFLPASDVVKNLLKPLEVLVTDVPKTSEANVMKIYNTIKENIVDGKISVNQIFNKARKQASTLAESDYASGGKAKNIIDNFINNVGEGQMYIGSKRGIESWQKANSAYKTFNDTFERASEYARFLDIRNANPEEFANTFIGSGSPSTSASAARFYDDAIKAAKVGNVNDVALRRDLDNIVTQRAIQSANFEPKSFTKEIKNLKIKNPSLWMRIDPKKKQELIFAANKIEKSSNLNDNINTMLDVFSAYVSKPNQRNIQALQSSLDALQNSAASAGIDISSRINDIKRVAQLKSIGQKTIVSADQLPRLLETNMATADDLAQSFLGSGPISSAQNAGTFFDQAIQVAGPRNAEAVKKTLIKSVFHKIINDATMPQDEFGRVFLDSKAIVDGVESLKNNVSLWNKFTPEQKSAINNMQRNMQFYKTQNSNINTIRNFFVANVGWLGMGPNYAATNATAALAKASPDVLAERLIDVLNSPIIYRQPTSKLDWVARQALPLATRQLMPSETQVQPGNQPQPLPQPNIGEQSSIQPTQRRLSYAEAKKQKGIA